MPPYLCGRALKNNIFNQLQECQGSVLGNACSWLKTITESLMSDIQRLIDTAFPFVQNLLSEYGEFFPLTSAIANDDSITQIGTYDGDERPISDKLIANLKKALKAKQGDYKCVTIFYNVSVVIPLTGLKSDAIVVFAEAQYEKNGYNIFYPYVLTKEKNLTIIEGAWKETIEKEIFLL